MGKKRSLVAEYVRKLNGPSQAYIEAEWRSARV